MGEGEGKGVDIMMYERGVGIRRKFVWKMRSDKGEDIVICGN